jgi:hypothetical protein
MAYQASSDTRKAYIGLVITLTVIAGALFAVWLGLAALDSAVATAVVAASATVLISVISLLVSKSWEQRRAIEEAHREHKRAIYEEFMGFWFSTITNPASGLDPPTEEEIQRFTALFTQKLILWASSDLLTRYNAFRMTASVLTADDAETSPLPLLAFEDVLYAIRRDLGHPKEDLAPGDLLRLFINDFDDFLESRTTDANEGSAS